MLEAETIRRAIADGLTCDYLQVQGDGHHFQAVIVSSQFVGQNKVKQHQLVYQALGDKMREEIHALSMQTFTPQAWANRHA